MRSDRVIGLNAVCTGLAGIALFLEPGPVGALYRVPESFPSYGMIRWLGAMLICIAMLLWILLPMVAAGPNRSLLRALSSLHVIGFIATAMQAVAVWATTAGYVTAAAYLVFALAYAMLAGRSTHPAVVRS